MNQYLFRIVFNGHLLTLGAICFIPTASWAQIVAKQHHMEC